MTLDPEALEVLRLHDCPHGRTVLPDEDFPSGQVYCHYCDMAIPGRTYVPADRDPLVEAARDVAAVARRYVLPIIGSDVTHATFEALLERLDAALGEGDKP